MEKSCYCCKKSSIDSSIPEKVNLNVALKELDKLKITPKSQELPVHRLPNCRSSNGQLPFKNSQSGFCILRMNKKFVTDFVTSAMTFDEISTLEDTSNSCGVSKTDEENCNYEELVRNYQTLKCSFKIRPGRTRFRFQKPYEIPWLHKLEERVRACKQDSEDSSDDGNSCNRSNPSSPSKSCRLTSNGALLRSRSLDNLAAKVCNDKQSSDDETLTMLTSENKDIERVAQQMKDLKVI